MAGIPLGRALALSVLFLSPAAAQEQPAPQHVHAATTPSGDLFSTREASGTVWLPDESPMYGLHRTLGPWGVMLHGTASAQFLYEPGDKHRTGGFANTQVSSVNWLMAMARRPLGAGR